MTDSALTQSSALWNRSRLDLRSDETLAQLLDRGEIAEWRALYRLAREDAALRARIGRLVTTVPLSMPYFWIAALASLDEDVDYDAKLPAHDRDWL